MTTPIKPPGSTPYPPELSEVTDVNAASKPSEPLPEPIDPSKEVAEAHPSNGVGIDPLASIFEQYRAGGIDSETALEKLLSRHIQNAGTTLSSPDSIGDLESLLRTSLQEDPTLLALTRHLKRQGQSDE